MVLAPSRVAAALTASLGLAGSAAAAQTQDGVRPDAAASLTSFAHESWTVEDGLPVNSIRQVLQSRDGYIWIATLDGLVRFDGVRFTVFSSATSPDLPSNRFVSLRETQDGSLWLQTETWQLVRFRHGLFTHIGPERGLGAEAVVVYEDPEGVLWVGTSEGLGRIEGERFVPVAEQAIRGLIRTIVRRSDGSLWTGVDGRGLFRLDGDRAEPVAALAELDATTFSYMEEDSARRLWIQSDAGLWAVEGASRADAPPAPDDRALDFRSEPEAALVTVGRRVYRVDIDPERVVIPRVGGMPGALDADGTLWFSNGTRLYTRAGSAWDLSAATGQTARATAITSLIADREGSLWLGTSNAGVHRLKPALFTTISDAEGLVNRNASTVHQDDAGTIWVGTRSGLSRIEEDGRISDSTRVAGTDSDVFSLLSDREDRLWVGTGTGLLSCRLPVMACQPVDTPSALRGPVYALHRDERGRAWAGVGPVALVLEDGRWTALGGRPGTAPVRAFAEAADGAIWMGTNGDGVLRYRDGRFTRIDRSDGLPSDLVRALYVDPDGWLWVGMEGRGLARLDPQAWGEGGGGRDRRIVHVGMAHGLYDGVIHQILEDDAGRLWMSTNRGIFWVPRAELLAFADGRAAGVHSTYYTERDGMRNREANGGFQPAGIRARDGRLWFPTQDGVVVVDPARITEGRVPPPVVIERVAAGGDSAFVPTGDPLRLGVDQRDVAIDYTSPSFLEPGNVRFRYRLDPYDRNWVDAGNRRTALYTHLPPGRYTFRVIASASGNAWNEAGAPLELTVLPRFHETAAARVLLVLGLMLLTAAALHWRLRNLRRRERELTRLVDERTAALRQHEIQLEAQNARLAELDQAKSRLFTNLSHEFRTPLTLILGPLRSVLDGRHGTLTAAMRDQGELMLRNGQRLLRLINQVLDLTKLQSGQVTLQRRSEDLVAFVRRVTLAFAPLAERRHISLHFRSEAPRLVMEFDAEQLEKVLLNLLSNALKFTAAGGVVEVTVGVAGDAATLAVRDTGVGIAPEDLARVFERFYQADTSATRRYEGTGIGLALARELVERHGGEIRVESAPGAGSTFTVRLPLADAPPAPARPDGTTRQSTSAILAARVSAAAAEVETLAAELPVRERGAPGPESAGGAGDEARGASGEPGDEAEDRTTVLIVDDNADVRAYVRSVLATSYGVIEASDGLAGLERARADLPDLIVADVMMPEMDGLALARALKDDRMTDAIPVILLTARAAPEDQIAGYETGADAYVVKPFEPAVLTAQVEGLLEQRRRLRERFRSGEATPPTPPAVVRSALEQRLRPLVEARLSEPDFGPEVLAAAAGLSYQKLYRALRDQLGVTPSRFIRAVRAECAAELLRQGAGSVTEIAYSVGFESLSYFRRAFRERFGTSPGEHLPARAGTRRP